MGYTPSHRIADINRFGSHPVTECFRNGDGFQCARALVREAGRYFVLVKILPFVRNESGGIDRINSFEIQVEKEMALAPLKRLVALMIGAVLARTVLCAVGLWLHAGGSELDSMFWIWIAARWLMGLIGAAVMGLLAWYTLKVPNTQSATGILYAGVIVVFMGELFSELLSVGHLYPL